MSEKRRPNFLLVVTDQMRADHVGYAGNGIVKTPHLDKLATAGTWWSRFYVASPTCMSNRATLMTGRMPSLNGVRHNGVPLDLESVTFVDLLRAAGYQTALMGKSHLQGITSTAPKVPKNEFPAHLTEPPPGLSEARRQHSKACHYTSEMSEHWQSNPQHEDNIPLPYYGFEQVKFCSGHGDRVSGHYSRWLEEQGYNGGFGFDASPEPSTIGAPQVYKPNLTEELYPTTFVANETINTLNQFAKSENPFFLQCSFPDPHHPFTPPGRYWDMFDPEQMELPKSFHTPNKDAVPPLRSLWNQFEQHHESERWTYPFVANEAHGREILAKTYGQIAMVDDAIGRIMAQLSSLNLIDNTIVCFMSDHGDYLGDHGLFLKGPINYQSIIRTPFTWCDPEPEFNLGAQDQLGSTLDVSSTILYRAGLQPANGMQGQDLFSQPRATSNPILVEVTTAYPYLGFDDLVSVWTMVSDKWRISIWEDCPWGELYDLENDPHELANLWDNTEYQSTKSSLLMDLIHAKQRHQETSPYPKSVS